MRLGLRSLLAVGYMLSAGACSGGYPLSPTRCDEYCDATKDFQCPDYYQPAGCVSNCEQNDTDTEACHVEFDAAVSCFRKDPKAEAALCDYSSATFFSRPCLTEQQALQTCTSNFLFPAAGISE